MKKIVRLFIFLMLAAMLPIAVMAKTVYVMDGGSGDGSTESSPVGTLKAALEALDANGGTIVLVGDTTHSGVTIPEQSGDLTVTSVNSAKMIIKGRTSLGKNTNDNVVTFDMPIDIAVNAACSFMGNFNSVVFTENFDVTVSGGESAAFSYYGGVICDAENNAPAITTLPYSITVNGGTFTRFECGNYRTESVAGSSSVVGSIPLPLPLR